MHALNISPYRDAKWVSLYVDTQVQFRKQCFPEQIRQILSGRRKLTDSLWILEEFADECSCQSFRVEILYKDTLYVIRINPYSSSNCEITKVVFSKNVDGKDFRKNHFELLEIKYRIAKNKSWTSEPLKYGSECDYGTHSFFSIIAPNHNAESVYVRCWSNWVGKSID